MMRKLLDLFGFGSAPRRKGSPITEPFTIVSKRNVGEVCQDFVLQSEAKLSLNGNPAPHDFVNRLWQANLYDDAIRYLAYALPQRPAIWWATLCVRSVPLCCCDDVSVTALQAGEEWVTHPNETNSKAALKAGQKHSFEMPTAPAGWVAMAVGWTSGNPNPCSEEPAVSPECLCAHAAAGAIVLAAVGEPDWAKERIQTFLETGVLIAQGKRQV